MICLFICCLVCNWGVNNVHCTFGIFLNLLLVTAVLSCQTIKAVMQIPSFKTISYVTRWTIWRLCHINCLKNCWVSALQLDKLCWWGMMQSTECRFDQTTLILVELYGTRNVCSAHCFASLPPVTHLVFSYGVSIYLIFFMTCDWSAHQLQCTNPESPHNQHKQAIQSAPWGSWLLALYCEFSLHIFPVVPF